MLKSMKTIEDLSDAPFDTYLYIEMDGGQTIEAYELSENDPLDIEAAIKAAYPDFQVTVYDEPMAANNYAAIITDGRAPDSGVVWCHAGFGIEF